MQFNNKIDVNVNGYDEFAQEIVESSSVLKCHILSDKKTVDDSDGGKTYKYELVILTQNSMFAPNNVMFSDDTLTFFYLNRKFKIKSASAIVDFNGKTKYYEVELTQVK